VIAIVFSYEARDAEEFEHAYGARGEWAEFFRGAEGYVGTEVLRDLENPGRYLVIDRWETADAYNAFIEENQAEYVERSDDARVYYDQELRLGSFENVLASET
jgi:heme-degrading monooxygenase HmoA